MRKIFIVRHGQDTDNAAGLLNGHRDTELTELGKRQALELSEKIKAHRIDVVYASPLKRAYETARIIADALSIDEVVADHHLIERDFGILTGKRVDEISAYATKTFQGDKVNYFIEAEGAEDFPALLKRADTILKEISQRHPEQNILIVTHGDLGKMIRAAYHNWTWEDALKTPYFANTGLLELAEKDVIE